MVESSFLSAFVYSIEKTMRSMLGSQCWSADVSPPIRGSYVAGVVYLSGRSHGRLALSFPRSTAQRVVAEMLGTTPVEVSEQLLQDGVAEVTNIVAGNAKALLADTRHAFQISLPRVMLGDSVLPGSHPSDRAENRCFQTPLGPLAMAVWLAE